MLARAALEAAMRARVGLVEDGGVGGGDEGEGGVGGGRRRLGVGLVEDGGVGGRDEGEGGGVGGGGGGTSLNTKE